MGTRKGQSEDQPRELGFQSHLSYSLYIGYAIGDYDTGVVVIGLFKGVLTRSLDHSSFGVVSTKPVLECRCC